MPETDKKRIQGRTLTVVNNQIKLDPKNPIPIQYNGNSFAIVKGKNYIPFIGMKDNFPNLLLEARLTSATQNACIDSIATSTVGNGVYVRNEEKPDPEFLNWMKSVNNELESFDDIMHGCVDGERAYGNQFVEVVKGSVGKVPFLKLYLQPIQYCRFAEKEKETDPTEVIVSKLFAKRGFRYDLTEARRVPLWSPNPLDQGTCWAKDDQGNFRTMLHFKNKVGGVDYYGMPASIAGLRYQVLEGKAAQYNLDNLDNNMILGGMLMFKSAMTEEEALKTAEKIIFSHVGEGKTGRIAVVSSESGLDDVQFTPYTTKNDGSFIEMDKRIEEKIIAANNWDAIFLGIAKGTHLGTGASYIMSVYDIKESTLLNPLRRKLLDKIIVPLMQIYADVFNKKDVLTYDLWFNTEAPYSMLGDLDKDAFVQVNEARELAGLPADDSKKGVYIAEIKPQQKANVPNQSIATEGANNN